MTLALIDEFLTTLCGGLLDYRSRNCTGAAIPVLKFAHYSGFS